MKIVFMGMVLTLGWVAGASAITPVPNWIGLDTGQLPKPVRYIMNPWNLDIYARGACFDSAMCASFTDEAKSGGPLPVLTVLEVKRVRDGTAITLTLGPLKCRKQSNKDANYTEQTCALDLVEYKYDNGGTEYVCRFSYADGVMDGMRDGKFYSVPCADVYFAE